MLPGVNLWVLFMTRCRYLHRQIFAVYFIFAAISLFMIPEYGY